MSIKFDSSATNNADWTTQFQFNDADTDDLIDFTGAYIEVEIKDRDHCKKIEATTDNGLVTVQSLSIIQLSVPASRMKCLCPDTYNVGALYTLNGETISLFTGSVVIIDGVARV